jgi:hypothetical protein
MEKREYEIKLITRHWNCEFYSEGPKRAIKKVVQFTPYSIKGKIYYNLCFGDWNAEKKLVDDLIISDNKDSLKVLVTVARSVISFTDNHPDAFVYIKGSTASRTRLFQIGITKHWIEISPLFTVFGITNNKWQPFSRSANYDAFIALRKNETHTGEQIRLTKVTVSNDTKDYSNDPFFIKQAQEAQEFLEKVGFPEELLKIKDLNNSKEIIDYSNDSTFIKRAQEAKEFLEKHPLPEELLKFIDAQNGKK